MVSFSLTNLFASSREKRVFLIYTYVLHLAPNGSLDRVTKECSLFCTAVVDGYPWSKTTSDTECTAIRILALLMLQKPAFLLVCAIVRFFILMPCKRLKKGSVGRCVLCDRRRNRSIEILFFFFFYDSR